MALSDLDLSLSSIAMLICCLNDGNSIFQVSFFLAYPQPCLQFFEDFLVQHDVGPKQVHKFFLLFSACPFNVCLPIDSNGLVGVLVLLFRAAFFVVLVQPFSFGAEARGRRGRRRCRKDSDGFWRWPNPTVTAKLRLSSTSQQNTWLLYTQTQQHLETLRSAKRKMLQRWQLHLLTRIENLDLATAYCITLFYWTFNLRYLGLLKSKIPLTIVHAFERSCISQSDQQTGQPSPHDIASTQHQHNDQYKGQEHKAPQLEILL